jgi:hypothetical protein
MDIPGVLLDWPCICIVLCWRLIQQPLGLIKVITKEARSWGRTHLVPHVYLAMRFIWIEGCEGCLGDRQGDYVPNLTYGICSMALKHDDR